MGQAVEFCGQVGELRTALASALGIAGLRHEAGDHAVELEPVEWIDQAQSLNIYMAGASGKKLDETYKLAWLRGLKTTYYLRTHSATNAEKSTVKSSQHNAVASGARSEAPAAAAVTAVPSSMSVAADEVAGSDVKFCALDNPDCEACQ